MSGIQAALNAPMETWLFTFSMFIAFIIMCNLMEKSFLKFKKYLTEKYDSKRGIFKIEKASHEELKLDRIIVLLDDIRKTCNPEAHKRDLESMHEVLEAAVKK